jgi:hypothetical protein
MPHEEPPPQNERLLACHRRRGPDVQLMAPHARRLSAGSARRAPKSQTLAVQPGDAVSDSDGRLVCYSSGLKGLERCCNSTICTSRPLALDLLRTLAGLDGRSSLVGRRCVDVDRLCFPGANKGHRNAGQPGALEGRREGRRFVQRESALYRLSPSCIVQGGEDAPPS